MGELRSRITQNRAASAVVLTAAAALTLSACSESVPGNAIAASTSEAPATSTPTVTPGKIALKANALEPVSTELCSPTVAVSDVVTVMNDLKIGANERDNWACNSENPYGNQSKRKYVAYGELVLNNSKNPIGSVEFVVIDDKLTDASGTFLDQVKQLPGAQQMSATEYYVPSSEQYPSPSVVRQLQGEGNSAVEYITQVNPRVDETNGGFVGHLPSSELMASELEQLSHDTVASAFPNYPVTN